MLRTVTATRYVTPLREGGSLPAIVEADDDGLYVLKFRGAGQGERALVAELIVGELARELGLPVPEIVFIEVDPLLARSEPDWEIQKLVQASAGLNLGLDFLPSALPFDMLVRNLPDADLASGVVWLDALTSNVDRTVRNTNMLLWHRRLWLIDHGAALIFHYVWAEDWLARARQPFTGVRDHVLLPLAATLPATDERLAALVTPDLLHRILALVPDAWLGDVPRFPTVAEHRAAYVAYLLHRLEAPRAFVEEALRARAPLV